MRLLNLYRNLDFGLSGGTPDKDELTDEQKAEIARVKKEEEEAKKAKADEEAAAKAKKGEGDEGGDEGGEGDEDDKDDKDKDKNKKDEDEVTFIKTLATKYGEVEGLEEIPESTEGVFAYIDKLIPNLEKEALEKKFKEKPILAALDKHLSEGKGIESFMKKQEVVDYSAIKPAKEDEATLIKYIKEDLVQKGVDNTTIDFVITAAKDKDALYDTFKTAIKSLDDKQKEQIRIKEEAEKDETERTRKAVEEEDRQLNAIVNSGKIMGIDIPKEKRQKFLDFITKPVTREGYTARDIASSKLTLEQQMYVDYLLMEGKLTLVTSAKKEKVKTLEDLKKAAEEAKKAEIGNKSSKTGTTGSGVPSLFEMGIS